MPINLSRFILAAEGLVVGLPLIWIYMQALPYFGFSSFTSLPSFLAFLLLIAMGASLAATLTVVGTFSVLGPSGLRQLRRTWWWLCAIGAVIALIGLALNFVPIRGNVVRGDLENMFYYGVFGAPLLVPYAHALCEYFYRTPAPMLPNPSLERP